MKECKKDYKQLQKELGQRQSYVDEKEELMKEHFGHYSTCLREVPRYSGSMNASWLVVDKLVDSCDFMLRGERDEEGEEWECAMGGSWRCEHKDKTAALAICGAALKFVRR